MLEVSKIVVGLCVASSVILANPSKDMNSLGISKNDKEFLFGTNNANIVALNDKEMKNTDGKWVGVAARAIGIGAMRAAQIKGSQDKNPNKNIPARKKYRTYKR